MKKATLALIGAMFSLSAVAAPPTDGGFDPSAAPPPPHKQLDNVKGADDAHIGSNVKMLTSKPQRENAWVSLEGNIIKKTGDNTYQFRDKTGSIDLMIPHDKWRGHKVKPNTLVNINGHLKNEHGRMFIAVDAVHAD